MKHFDIEGDIEKGIEAAQNVTVEFAIAEAIMKGRMTPEEGAECIDCYYRTLNSTTSGEPTKTDKLGPNLHSE